MPKQILRLAFLLAALQVAACSSDDVYERGVALARSGAGLELHSVQIDGNTFTYLERPGDGPAIVMLHGFASEKDAWLMFARRLPDSYRLIALDLPGHGDSSFDPALTWTAQAIAERAGRFVDRLVPGKVNLVGNSLGGMVAILIAARRPDRVQSVALFDAAGVYPETPSEFEQAIERGENPLIVRSEEDFEGLLDYVFHKRPFIPWPVQSVLTRRMIARAGVNAHIFSDLWASSETLDAVLPGIRVPVLIVWGEQDRVLHPSSAQVFEHLLPDTRVVMMPGVGHSPMAEEPRQSARLYADFVGQVTR